LLVVRWGGFAMRTFLLPNVDWVDDPLDLRTATFAAIATLLTVLLAVWPPRSPRVAASSTTCCEPARPARAPRHVTIGSAADCSWPRRRSR
jgi:hypothetical protein